VVSIGRLCILFLLIILVPAELRAQGLFTDKKILIIKRSRPKAKLPEMTIIPPSRDSLPTRFSRPEDEATLEADTNIWVLKPIHLTPVPLFDEHKLTKPLVRIDFNHICPNFHCDHPASGGIAFDAGRILSSEIRRQIRDKKHKEEADRLMKHY
jgi:hypothetical protein